MTGYDRDEFGTRWSDDVDVPSGHNGCDQRSDILRRGLTDLQLKPKTRGCVPLSGTLHDPYTGRTIEFVRGANTSDDVQIDHMLSGGSPSMVSISAGRIDSGMPMTR